jgi:F0F1-type ATP synthase assembly protein I
VPGNGDTERPESIDDAQDQPPSPDEYERLSREAADLRKSSDVGRSTSTARREEGGGKAYLKYTTLGIQFLMAMLLPIGAGYWLDAKLGTSPWLVMAGAILGCVGAMTWIIVSYLRDEKQAESKTGESKTGKKAK